MLEGLGEFAPGLCLHRQLYCALPQAEALLSLSALLIAMWQALQDVKGGAKWPN